MRMKLSIFTVALLALLTVPSWHTFTPIVSAQNTALNRTTAALLTNKSGGSVSYGDVVVLDNTNAKGFTTTTTGAISTRGLGVVLEPNGIANNASGMVAVGGWVPKVNLNTAATVGQFLKTHTVAGQATPHSSPQVEGDFGVALQASATPEAILFGSANGPSSGGGSGTVTNTGTLTSGKTIIGNGSADVTVSSLTAQFVGSSSGTEAAASMTTNRLLGRTTAGSGAVEELTAGDGLVLSAGTLTAATASSATQAATADTSMSADTMTDITGASLTLAAGTWRLSAQICFSSTSVVYAIGLIAKSDNTVLVSSAGGTVNGYQTLTIAPWQVVVGSSTTYKLRIQTGSASSIARQLDNGSFGTATFITAERVK